MPAKLPYTKQIITKSGRMKTLYPFLCAYCFKGGFGFRKDNGKRYCNMSCCAKHQYKNGRDKMESTKKAIQKTKSMEYRPLYGARGANHRNWKGGITPINEKIRKSREYRSWRERVFSRDNYTCVLCGKHGGNLIADHIKGFSKYPEFRFDIDNGRTLCKDCNYISTYKLKEWKI